MRKIIYLFGIILFSMIALNSYSQDAKEENMPKEEQILDKEKLVVMWTSGEREVALKMVFMYTYNAKKHDWWKDITLLIWGPSAKLLSEDEEIQKYVADMKKIGVNLLACKGCADSYGVSEELEELGVTVKYTGQDLTTFIKSDIHLVTF